MVKKVILIGVAVLLLAVIGLVVKERVSPPEPALAGASTLTVLSGDQVYLSEEKITGTVIIEEGDSVRTGNDSWALVTFEDGSTVELEPNTEISIKELTDTAITVWQEVGRTWSGIKKLVGPLTDFELETPSAGAVVRGTLVETVVERIGDTIAACFEGTIVVTAQGVTQIIEAFMQSLIEMGQAPEDPEPVPPPKNRLEVTIEGPAWALVVDWPQERSAGVLPPGVVVNQIPRATTTGAQAEPQFMVVPVPEEEGEKTYYVVLYGKDDGGKADVEVKGYVEGQNVFTETQDKVVGAYELEDDTETKYVAELTVTVNEDGDITGGELGEFELKQTEGPGKIEIKDWAVARSDDLAAPQANFSVSVEEETICFTSLSTGDITTYSWDFGDGNTSVQMNPSHVYSEGGGYLVSLEVSGPGGKDKAHKEIYVLVITQGT
ncbi:MAG: PKD domain-containing protein [Dehalococcoidia bacterium]|nr:PKD domain-containing protein [Dehalococcoidia bacterium]